MTGNALDTLSGKRRQRKAPLEIGDLQDGLARQVSFDPPSHHFDFRKLRHGVRADTPSFDPEKKGVVLRKEAR